MARRALDRGPLLSLPGEPLGLGLFASPSSMTNEYGKAPQRERKSRLPHAPPHQTTCCSLVLSPHARRPDWLATTRWRCKQTVQARPDPLTQYRQADRVRPAIGACVQPPARNRDLAPRSLLRRSPPSRNQFRSSGSGQPCGPSRMAPARGLFAASTWTAPGRPGASGRVPVFARAQPCRTRSHAAHTGSLAAGACPATAVTRPAP